MSVKVAPVYVCMSHTHTHTHTHKRKQGEFSAKQFEKMMHGELHRYSNRAVQNSMQETPSKEDRAILLGMKVSKLKLT